MTRTRDEWRSSIEQRAKEGGRRKDEKATGKDRLVVRGTVRPAADHRATLT
eukprot:CAMPEP_0181119210 /NCGR_PEP_ID=MMETSP1071-20121207/23486_1 /TAXON_ID=35127 /ORGANISM="Thalassiosira sp., Strain NH16" /LENGTH=50 /DNA_ID=CAMNT_0023203753 /DNA_START=95 /DNA_END=244 /DNA_ORIENTATION=+